MRAALHNIISEVSRVSHIRGVSTSSTVVDSRHNYNVAADAEQTNLAARMNEMGFAVYQAHEYHAWTSQNRGAHLQQMAKALKVTFHTPPSKSYENGRFIPGATLNPVDWIVANDKRSTAFVYQNTDGGPILKMLYGEFSDNIARAANTMTESGLEQGDTIALNMPRSPASQAIFYGAIAKGIKVVPIRTTDVEDRIADFMYATSVKVIFSTDHIHKGGKQHPMYEKMVAVRERMETAPPIVVLPSKGSEVTVALQERDRAYNSILSPDTQLTTVSLDPNEPIFYHQSSGTTSTPKIIPQTSLTIVKGGMDGHLALDVKPGDVVGGFFENAWVMGPMQDASAFLNGAAVALTPSPAVTKDGTDFIKQSGTTQIVIVPAFMEGDKGWIQSGFMHKGVNSLKYIGFTGAPSNPKYDLAASLIGLNNPEKRKPVRVSNYIGGTELGGGYGYQWTVETPKHGYFRPAFGMDYGVFDEHGSPTPQEQVGALYLLGADNAAAVGTSFTLANKDHFKEYQAGLPDSLRRTGRIHGDLAIESKDGTRNQGRADGIANIGGEKISAAQLQEPIDAMDLHSRGFGAAVVIFPKNKEGNEEIVIVVEGATKPAEQLQKEMQNVIRQNTHKGMRVAEVVLVDELSRGPGGKVSAKAIKQAYESGKIGSFVKRLDTESKEPESRIIQSKL